MLKRESGIAALMAAFLLVMIVAARCGGYQTGTPNGGGHQTPAAEVHFDTIVIHDTIHKAGPEVVREEVREVPAAVDTAAILSAFYTERILSDTLHLRDVATVRITDTLFQNDIIGRGVDYDLSVLQPTVTIYPTETTERRNGAPVRLAISAGAQLGREQAAVMVGLRIRRAEIVGGYDLRLHTPSITLKYDLWQWQ